MVSVLVADHNMTAKKQVSKTPTKEQVEEVAPVPEVVQAPEPTKEEVKEIKVIERIIENREIAPQDAFGKMNRVQIDLIKRTVAKGASDDELKLFIQVCKGANLNPFLKQVHLIPRWDAKLGAETRTIQVSIDGFRAIAESSGDYAGNEDPIYTGESEVEYSVGKDSKTVQKVTAPNEAKVTVYKMVQGQRFAFTATARWSEYYPGARMGFQWHVRPYLMLGKCAEALALRKAFPKLLSGMYAQEELDKSTGEQAPQSDPAQVVKNMIAKMSMEDIDDFGIKMSASKKYSKEQKAEFKALVDKRMQELTGEVS